MIGREGVKKSLVDQFGGACQRCGFSGSLRALQFHHDNPATKEGRDILKEVSAHPEHFTLLCANCHFTVHDELDRSRRLYRTCLTCSKSFHVKQDSPSRVGRGKFCSRACQHAARNIRARTDETKLSRVMKHVDVVGDCWLWNANMAGSNTPTINVTRDDGTHAPVTVRRLVYRLTYGKEPSAKRIYASCGSNRCVSPSHFCSRGGQTIS
jgi:hypothetical protein